MYVRCPLRSPRLLYDSGLESSMKLSKKTRKTVWMKKKSKKEMLYPRKRKLLKRLRCPTYSSLITSNEVNLFSESSTGIAEQAGQAGIRDTGLSSGTNQLVTSGYESEMSLGASGVNPPPSLEFQLSNHPQTREILAGYLDSATHLKEPYFEYSESHGEFVESPEASITNAAEAEPEDMRETSSDIASTVIDTEPQLSINYKQSENPASLTVENDSVLGASERSDDLLVAAAEICLSPSLADSDSEEQDTESIEDQQTPEARSFNFLPTQHNSDQESEDFGAPELQIPEIRGANELEARNDVQPPGPNFYPLEEEESYLEDGDANVYILNRNLLNYDINIRRCRRFQQNGSFLKCFICFNRQAAVENAPCCCICYCIDCAPGMIKCALCYENI